MMIFDSIDVLPASFSATIVYRPESLCLARSTSSWIRPCEVCVRYLDPRASVDPGYVHHNANCASSEHTLTNNVFLNEQDMAEKVAISQLSR